MRYAAGFMTVFLCLANGSPMAADDLVIGEPFATVGEPIAVTFDNENREGLTLRVIYRPNSETEKIEKAGSFDENGGLTWTPTEPGLATLTIMNEGGESLASLEVGVCFSETPAGGILVMVLAGLLLFGGAGFSLVIALRGVS